MRTRRGTAGRRDAAPVVDAPLALTPTRLWLALGLLAAPLLYGTLESLLWRRQLWGAHALAYLPRAWWLLLPVCAAAFLPSTARAFEALAAGWRPGERWRRALPWLAGAATALLFALARERHLFWGDALPVSIDVPAGQTFHPNEPLTLWLHHALWALGGGRWSAASAIALASAACGGVLAALAARLVLSLTDDVAAALLATAVFVLQGACAIFHGHVENYAYVGLLLFVFLAGGLAFLAGRGPLAVPLGALLLGFAFHLLGALALPAALYLVALGVVRPRTRGATLLTLAIAIAFALAANQLARGPYAGGSPLRRIADGVLMILAQPHDMQPRAFFSWRHLADAWSHVVFVGPLSLVLVGALACVLPGRALLASHAGRFVAIAALTCYGPALLTGEGNLGAARNWDLFAGQAMGIALFGVLLLLALPGSARRRLLLAALGATLFQALPWLALNVDADRTAACVAELPLGHGRAAAELGTYYLNAADLERADRWFRRALAEDATNPNAESGLGLALARRNRFAEAEPHMAAVVRLKPTVPQYRRDLALLCLREGKPELASAQWQMLLALQPDDVPAWLGLAQAMSDAGRPDSVVYALLAARARVPASAEVRAALADGFAAWAGAAERAGDEAQFVRVWRVFAREYPDDARVQAGRAHAEAAGARGR